MHRIYRELVAPWPATPYNLLATRRWMLVVPRRQERYESISVNALGFAGSLYVRNSAELALVRRAGPLNVLRAVTLE
jgi:ATP adenylyltransferase